jgi:hypothetical protein
MIGLTVPAPSSDIITNIALPLKVLPLIVTAEIPQMLVDVLLRLIAGVMH